MFYQSLMGVKVPRPRLSRAAAGLCLVCLAAVDAACGDHKSAPTMPSPPAVNIAGTWSLTSKVLAAAPAGNCWADFLIGVTGQTSMPIQIVVTQTDSSITVMPKGLQAGATACTTSGTVGGPAGTSLSTHLVSCNPASATFMCPSPSSQSLQVTLTALDTTGTVSGNRVSMTSTAQWTTTDAATGAATGQVTATLDLEATK